MSAYRCLTDPPGAGGNNNNLLLHRAVWRLSCGCRLWDRCAESGVLFERAYLCSWPCLTSSGGAGAAGSSAAVLFLSPEYSRSPIPSQQHLGEWNYLSAKRPAFGSFGISGLWKCFTRRPSSGASHSSGQDLGFITIVLCVATLLAHSAAGLETEVAAIRSGSGREAHWYWVFSKVLIGAHFSKVLNSSSMPASSLQAERPLRLCIVLAHAGQRTSEKLSNQSQLPGVATTAK